MKVGLTLRVDPSQRADGRGIGIDAIVRGLLTAGSTLGFCADKKVRLSNSICAPVRQAWITPALYRNAGVVATVTIDRVW